MVEVHRFLGVVREDPGQEEEEEEGEYSEKEQEEIQEEINRELDARYHFEEGEAELFQEDPTFRAFVSLEEPPF